MATVEQYNREQAEKSMRWDVADERLHLNHAKFDHGKSPNGAVRRVDGIAILTTFLATCDTRRWDFKDREKALRELKSLAKSNLNDLLAG